MATTYPGTIDTFTNPAGTDTLDSPDHALQHSDKNDAIEAIEAAVGTTAGTGVLTNFTAGDLPVRQNTANVLQDTLAGGTANNFTIGTPSITGGTVNGSNLENTLDASGGTISGAEIAGASTFSGTATVSGKVSYGDSMPSTNVRCRAYLGSNQSYTTASFDLVEFDTESYDSGGDFNTTTHIYTAPVDGFYLLFAQTYTTVGADGDYIINTLQNNGVTIAESRREVGGASSQTFSVSTTAQLSAGDEIKLLFSNQNNNDTITAGSDKTFLEIHLLST